VAGVTTTPPAGRYYIQSYRNFNFSAIYANPVPFAVHTNRLVDGKREILPGRQNQNMEYEYVIQRVQEPIYIQIGPDFVTSSNASIDETSVWSHREMLYIKVDREDIASIYSIAGQLIKRIEVPEGNTSIPMERGVYVVTLKDGAVHKIIIQ
jgi:hypothetical protein